MAAARLQLVVVCYNVSSSETASVGNAELMPIELGRSQVQGLKNNNMFCSLARGLGSPKLCKGSTLLTRIKSMVKQAIGGRPPRYAPAPLLPLWAPKRHSAAEHTAT